ncbi:unnamed protein product [Pleuronectes platessa]|uniref:Non-structural maintenance of chromosomes element 4 n=1 Tax=Pleuronectes platessa TaxID=8262 RepID=A0A9N7VQZ8_PLEPL|nr:unnamed protein product [Pleuronectes platessa]
MTTNNDLTVKSVCRKNHTVRGLERHLPVRLSTITEVSSTFDRHAEQRVSLSPPHSAPHRPNMKRSKGGSGDDPPRENGSSGRRRKVELPQSNGDDSDSGYGPTDLRDDGDNDPAARREIRSRYRDLINTVQQSREDMLNPSNNKLTEVLEEANKLFEDVRQAREAALDSQLLVMATDLGKEKASQMFAEGIAFDPAAFTEHLLSFMGLNRLEDGEDEQNGGTVEGYLPQDAWHRVAQEGRGLFQDRTLLPLHDGLVPCRAASSKAKDSATK